MYSINKNLIIQLFSKFIENLYKKMSFKNLNAPMKIEPINPNITFAYKLICKIILIYLLYKKSVEPFLRYLLK